MGARFTQQLERHRDSSRDESRSPMSGCWNDGRHALATTSGGTISGRFFGNGSEDNDMPWRPAQVDLVSWELSNCLWSRTERPPPQDKPSDRHLHGFANMVEHQLPQRSVEGGGLIRIHPLP